MDVTDVEELGGTPLGVVKACSGPSGSPPVATVPPNRCLRTVPSNTDAVVVHLAQKGLTARFLHDGGTH